MANKRRRSGGAIKAPDLPQQKLEKAPPGNWIEDGMNCTQSILMRNDLSGRSVRHLSFDQILFEQVEMSRTHVEYVRVLDSRFQACNFTNAKWMRVDFALLLKNGRLLENSIAYGYKKIGIFAELACPPPKRWAG